jgi:hypothetical protein
VPQFRPEDAAPAGRPVRVRRPVYCTGRPGARPGGFRRGARRRRDGTEARQFVNEFRRQAPRMECRTRRPVQYFPKAFQELSCPSRTCSALVPLWRRIRVQSAGKRERAGAPPPAPLNPNPKNDHHKDTKAPKNTGVAHYGGMPDQPPQGRSPLAVPDSRFAYPPWCFRALVVKDFRIMVNRMLRTLCWQGCSKRFTCKAERDARCEAYLARTSQHRANAGAPTADGSPQVDLFQQPARECPVTLAPSGSRAARRSRNRAAAPSPS